MGKELKKKRRELNLTLEDLGKKIGVSRATIQRYESSVINIPSERLEQLAEALETTPGYLMGWEEPSSRIPLLENVVDDKPVSSKSEILGYEEITPDLALNGDYFALKVKGNSMEPMILENDIAIVKQQDDVETGDVAVVLINGYDATLKKISKSVGGITLIACNMQVYEPHFYSWEDIEKIPIKIIGKVVELRRSF